MRYLWVDDAKPVPLGLEEDCAVARSYEDAERMMRSFTYERLYLDHDLGDPQNRTGLHLLRQMREEKRLPPYVECISWNPVGKAAIEAQVRDYANQNE